MRMLKIVHLLTGVIALLLSFVPSLRGEMPLLLQPEALCLLLLGLLNVQFIPSTQLNATQRTRPVIGAVSILLVLSVAIQAAVLLVPLSEIAGQPATLASLLLAVVAVLLHLATGQAREERSVRRTVPAGSKQKDQTTALSAGRE